MDSFNLEPRYSSGELPGKCIKCLAEQDLDSCLRELLRGEDSEELQQRYEMLVTFLKSPESQKLRAESERCLSEGKEVTVRIYFVNGKPKYDLKVKE